MRATLRMSACVSRFGWFGGTAGTLSVRSDGQLVNHGTGTMAGGLLGFQDGASMLNDGVTTITGEMRKRAKVGITTPAAPRITNAS